MGMHYLGMPDMSGYQKVVYPTYPVYPGIPGSNQPDIPDLTGYVKSPVPGVPEVAYPVYLERRTRHIYRTRHTRVCTTSYPAIPNVM